MFKNSSQALKVVLSVLFAVAVLGYIVLMSGVSTTNQGATTTQPSISMDEAQKQIKAIQDQVNAGTLSSAEATKLINALGSKIAPPPLPAGAKK